MPAGSSTSKHWRRAVARARKRAVARASGGWQQGLAASRVTTVPGGSTTSKGRRQATSRACGRQQHEQGGHRKCLASSSNGGEQPRVHPLGLLGNLGDLLIHLGQTCAKGSLVTVFGHIISVTIEMITF